MAQYKTVQVPRINIGHGNNHADAIKQFQSVIENEATDGWMLVCSHTISVTQEPKPLEPIGCLGQLLIMFNLKQRQEIPIAKTYHIDMLIFVKN